MPARDHKIEQIRQPPEADVSHDPLASAAWKEAAAEYQQKRGGRTLVVETEPKRLARARALMCADDSFERAYAELTDPRNRPTPQVTIEAIWQTVRERGLAALKEPATRERLARCDDAARAELERRIAKIKK